LSSPRDPRKIHEVESTPAEAVERDGLTEAGVPDPSVGVSDSSIVEQLQKALAEKQELMNTFVRRQADFENYRKRVEKERHQDRHRAVESLIENILPALDAFDRAIASHDDPAYAEYNKGFELIRRQLWDALAKQGLERIESIGKQFDPNFHHGIEQVQTSEHADGTVVDELQPGYVFHGRILRPAMVRVASSPTKASRA
jgi:molecular chaperone GrpE